MSAGEKPSGEPVAEKGSDEAPRPDENVAGEERTVPLFLRDGNDGRKGDAQDEKDEVGE